jgi:alkylation response protein AidB-like acyl-CoA dehydrogenase
VDFTFSEDQDSLRGLAAQIFTDQATPERSKAAEDSGDPYDRDLWAALADANLLGLCLPEDVGGSGYGLVELGIVLEEAGRHVARVPLLGALPVARFGSAAQRPQWLPGVSDGRIILTAALDEAGGADPLAPTTTASPASPASPASLASPDGTGWRLHGTKVAVPYGPQADRVVVSATIPGNGTGLFLIDPTAPGTDMAPATSTTGEPLGLLTMDGTLVEGGDRLGGSFSGDGVDPVRWSYQRAVAGMCAVAAGVLEGGLRITTEYIGQRQQFGRALASFQGPAMRIADAYIDTQAVGVTTWSAIWRLEQGLPADEELAIAKFWVADGGQRAVHAFQHLHGGMGLDTSYPIHRYFTWAKALEASLGGATAQLLRIGEFLANPPQEITTHVA